MSFLQKWKIDLQRSFRVTQKQNILRFSLKSSIFRKTQQSNYKILTRWYYMPQLLHKYYPNTTDSCWRCQTDRGMHLHIFWSCPLLKHFWSTVRKVTQKFTDHRIPDDLAFFLSMPTQYQQKSTKNQ